MKLLQVELGGATIAPTVSTSQNIENFEAATEYSLTGKVIAKGDVFATVSGSDVSGNDVSGGDATVDVDIDGAEVSIKGNGISKTTLTDEDGNFTFKNLKKGVYQIKVVKDDKVGSAIVNIDTLEENCTIELHKGSDTVDTGNTGIMVGGLGDLLNADSPIMDADDKAVLAAGGSLSVGFKATTANAEDVEALKAFANQKDQKIGTVYDFSINKTANDAAGAVVSGYPKAVSETGKLISIVMPISEDMKNATDYTIYRVHNGVTEAITTTPNASGEYIEVLKDEGVVIAHVSKFSAYALGGKVASDYVPDDEDSNDENEVSRNTTTVNAKSPKTGDANVPAMFWVVMAGFFVAAVTCAKKAFKKEN